MRWLRTMVAKALESRRTRRDFARLRGELEELNRRVGEMPWWTELPPEERRRSRG